jgi:hypothetical protein
VDRARFHVDFLAGSRREEERTEDQSRRSIPHFVHNFVSTKYFCGLTKVIRVLKMRYFA